MAVFQLLEYGDEEIAIILCVGKVTIGKGEVYFGGVSSSVEGLLSVGLETYATNCNGRRASLCSQKVG